MILKKFLADWHLCEKNFGWQAYPRKKFWLAGISPKKFLAGRYPQKILFGRQSGSEKKFWLAEKFWQPPPPEPNGPRPNYLKNRYIRTEKFI